MSEKSTSEKREVAQKVELKIVEPRDDKNFMVGFNGRTKEECQAYNWAIESVLENAGLRPFHQVGTSSFGQHEPGYHAWEIGKKVTKEDLGVLLTEIEKEALSTLAE